MDPTLVDFLAVAQLAWWPVSKSLYALSKCIYALQFVLLVALRVVLVLLSPIWNVISFLLLPFVHLAKGLFTVVTFPLQVKWLERIETLYIYLGTAGLIGCMTGAVLYFIFNLLSSSLSSHATSNPKPRRSRTAAEFRTEQREKREERLSDYSGPSRVISERTPASKRRDLLSQSIAEEEDSDL
ncbi:hypothetical protein E8E13_000128 [Curvularia kusanoi]|uniref:Uncharacterized protein n=1 Tax=Curvularia kusanoi TaxID=90978 RepID=A0A9P4W9A2_CURKU|nr:hypothetical protein E8E13_000128 [Curvularia kusanoi]